VARIGVFVAGLGAAGGRRGGGWCARAGAGALASTATWATGAMRVPIALSLIVGSPFVGREP
jgi:hypothetical protein